MTGLSTTRGAARPGLCPPQALRRRCRTRVAHADRNPEHAAGVASGGAGQDPVAGGFLARLATLAEQLLDIQRLDRCGHPFTRVDLVAISQSAAADLAPLAIAAGYELALDAPSTPVETIGEVALGPRADQPRAECDPARTSPRHHRHSCRAGPRTSRSRTKAPASADQRDKYPRAVLPADTAHSPVPFASASTWCARSCSCMAATSRSRTQRSAARASGFHCRQSGRIDAIGMRPAMLSQCTSDCSAASPLTCEVQQDAGVRMPNDFLSLFLLDGMTSPAPRRRDRAVRRGAGRSHHPRDHRIDRPCSSSRPRHRRVYRQAAQTRRAPAGPHADRIRLRLHEGAPRCVSPTRASCGWMRGRLATERLYDGVPVGAVVSGLPLLNMSTRKVVSTQHRRWRVQSCPPGGGAFYQFTYD